MKEPLTADVIFSLRPPRSQEDQQCCRALHLFDFDTAVDSSHALPPLHSTIHPSRIHPGRHNRPSTLCKKVGKHKGIDRCHRSLTFAIEQRSKGSGR